MMNSNIKKIVKLIYAISIVFLIFNVFINNSVFATSGGSNTKQFGPLPKELATVCKAIITFTQIFVTGAFTIRLSVLGIQYFTAVGADLKAANKRRMAWTLLIGVITILAIWIFGKLIDTL